MNRSGRLEISAGYPVESAMVAAELRFIHTQPLMLNQLLRKGVIYESAAGDWASVISDLCGKQILRNLFFSLFTGIFQQRIDPGDKFFIGKRLGDVGIRTQGQPPGDFGLIPPGSQKGYFDMTIVRV